MANNNKKPEGGKPAPKIETLNLKVLIHCEGCKKKVRKTLYSIEGVHTVEVDESLGKVTVTGTVDAKILIKKLEKAGKIAEVFPSSGAKGKVQQKGDNNQNNNKEGKENKEGGNDANADTDKKDGNAEKGNNTNDGGESGKKKKGGGGPNSTGMNRLDENMNMANKSIAPTSIQTGYISTDSAEYATHMFSDENAHNCHIM